MVRGSAVASVRLPAPRLDTDRFTKTRGEIWNA
jgi:hypothetical protein